VYKRQVDFLTTRPEINEKKIGVLGICASAGYATDAALSSDKVKATATVAPWYHDQAIVEEVYGENIPVLLQLSQDAKSKWESKGEMTLVPAAGVDDKNAIMQGFGYYSDPSRGAIPSYDNQFNLLTWEAWLNYDAIQTASKLKKPTLLVHSEAAAIPQGAKKYLEAAGPHAKAVWLDNVTQFDFYDGKEAMQTASDAVAQHFKNNL